MSSFNIYDVLTYEVNEFKDFNSVKDYLSEKLQKGYFIMDKNGNDNVGTINAYSGDKNIEYVISKVSANFISESYCDNKSLSINDIKNKTKNQKKIESIINQNLNKKKKKMEKAFEVCEEIVKKSNDIKDKGEESIQKFEKNFEEFKNNPELKKIIQRIKQSLNQLKKVSPDYKEEFESTNKLKDQVFNEIDKIINKKYEGPGHDDTNDENEMRKFCIKYSEFIKNKISKIEDIIKTIRDLESNINLLLISAEKINFYINLSEIPCIYESFKPKLEEELKRRCYFKYLCEKIIEYVKSNLFPKEFEQKKQFFKTYLNLSNKCKIEEKTIEILLKLFDIKQEKIYEDLNEIINDDIIFNIGSQDDKDEIIKKERTQFDEDLIKELETIKTNIESLQNDLYSKKKKKNISKKFGEKSEKFKLEIEEIKNKLNSFSIPEIKKREILDIIESKIIKELPNASDANKTAPTDIEKGNGRNNIMDSDIMMSGYGSNIILGNKDCGGKGEDIAIMKATNYFTDKYSNFLWFYNKVFNYLEIYNKNIADKKFDLKKEDPFSLNNCIIEILNDNKKMKEKIRKIRECTKNWKK